MIVAGYGFAKMGKTQQDEVSNFLRGYLCNRPSLRLVTLLVDSRREAQDLDLQMIKFLNDEGLPYLIVSTKVDKLSSNEIQQSNAVFSAAFEIAPKKPVAFSSVTGTGRREVWAAIRGGILGDQSFLSCNYEDDEEEDDEDGDDSEGGSFDENEDEY